MPVDCIEKQYVHIKWLTRRHNTMIIFLVLMAITKHCEGAGSGGGADEEACPIGFELLEIESRPLCYKLKEPETYGEKYINCHGNRDNGSLWKYIPDNRLGEVKIWTDFLRMNEDGVLINWSLGSRFMGRPLSTFPYKMDDKYEDVKLMCTVFDMATKKLRSVDCNNRYPRFCMIDAYQELSTDGFCPNDEYFRFYTPLSTCLQLYSTNKTTARLARLRATWSQAAETCNKTDGYLLEKGYIYTNHPSFGSEHAMQWELPMGIQRKGKTSFYWSGNINGYSSEKIREIEWNFGLEVNFTNNFEHVAILDRKWVIVNDSNIFYYVICEHPIQLPRPNIITSYKSSGSLEVNVNNTSMTEEQLWCFTDSSTYFPTRVHLTRKMKSNVFVIKPGNDGYYWCISINTTTHSPQESNKELFVREKSRLDRLYAIMLKLEDKYEEYELRGLEKKIEKSLNELIYYRIMMTENFETERMKTNLSLAVNKQVKRFRSTDYENSLYGLVIKRIYADKRQILVHAYLGTNIEVLPEGEWKELHILYMRRTYYCEEEDFRPQESLGRYYNVPNSCVRYKCSGDYNVGAYWELYNSKGCSMPTSTTQQTESLSTEMESITTPIPESESNSSVDNSNSNESYENLPEIISQTPSEHLQQVINTIQDMANKTDLNVTNLQDVASQINDVLNIPDIYIPNELLYYFDAILRRVALATDNPVAKIIEANMAVVIVDNTDNRYVGMKLENPTGNDLLTNNTIQLINEDEISSITIDKMTTEVFVQIPKNLTMYNERISFVVFRNDRAFNTRFKTHDKVNSRVLSVSITNSTNTRHNFPDGNYIYIHLKPYETDIFENESRLCAFWDFQQEPYGKWSTDGCELIKSYNSGLDMCRCNHLTQFAEIISIGRIYISETQNYILSVITVVGCVLSLFGLVVIGLTGAIFKNWRKEFINKIWLNLSAAITLFIISYFLLASNGKENVSVTTCIVVGSILHYSLLTSFSWMIISAIISYQRLVTVFVKNTSHRLLKACVFAWGFPVICVGTLLIADPYNYAVSLTDDLESNRNKFCFPTGLGYWLSLFLPVLVAIVINTILFVCIIYSVFINTKVKRHGDNQEIFRSLTVSFLLFFLFGLSWIFGIFSNIIIFNYLFSLTGTLQGFVMFIFFVIGNKKSREMWLEFLKLKEKKKIPVSSTSSRISAYRRESSNGRLTIGKFEDSNSTKPRALSGTTDNSRFS